MLQKDNSVKKTFMHEARSFPPAFFEDEVRDGFFVPETMKRFWAGHLTVLSVIDNICTRHNIRWWAAFGTLLGAARHSGFIPWDDDIDIVMFRADLDRFLEIAKQELPPYLGIRDVQTQPAYNALCVRVTSTFLADGHLEHFHGSLYSASVDIFALDNVYDEPQKEAERMRRLAMVCSAGAYFQPGKPDEAGNRPTRSEREPEQAEEAVRRVETLFGTRLDRKNHLFGHLLQLIVRLFRDCPDSSSPHVKLFMDNEWFWQKERVWFRDTVYLPFEHITMPVCADYEKEPVAEYGDWHIILRGGGHGAPAYTEQEAYMRKKTGKNMFRYTYNEADLSAPRTPPLRERVSDMLSMLRKAQEQAALLADAGNTEPAGQLLTSCQTLAVTLGETLENALSPDAPCIRFLEDYCEAVYVCHESSSGTRIREALSVLDASEQAVTQALQTRKEIVFLPVRAAWWNTMEPVWQAARALPDADVYVLPVPWEERDENGSRTGRMHDETAGFPAELKLTGAEQYDIAAKCPDVIVTQFPYEALYRPVGIDPLYYASSLRNFTGQLIYVPCYDVETPVEDDKTARNTLRYLIEQPSVVFADQVIVMTDGMRDLYVDTMSEIAGNDTRSVWENKIRSFQMPDSPRSSGCIFP